MSTLREVILLIIRAYSLHLALIVAYFKSKVLAFRLYFTRPGLYSSVEDVQPYQNPPPKCQVERGGRASQNLIYVCVGKVKGLFAVSQTDRIPTM